MPSLSSSVLHPLNLTSRKITPKNAHTSFTFHERNNNFKNHLHSKTPILLPQSSPQKNKPNAGDKTAADMNWKRLWLFGGRLPLLNNSLKCFTWLTLIAGFTGYDIRLFVIGVFYAGHFRQSESFHMSLFTHGDSVRDLKKTHISSARCRGEAEMEAGPGAGVLSPPCCSHLKLPSDSLTSLITFF